MPNLGTVNSETISGTSEDDIIFGYDGDDKLIGRSGADVFYEGYHEWGGETNSDFIFGELYDFGRGNDTIFGGQGIDVLLYSNLTEDIEIDLDSSTVSRNSSVDSFNSIEIIYTGAGSDTLLGSTRNITVDLGAGNDLVVGFSTKSTIYGGDYDTDIDVLDFSAAQGNLTFNTNGAVRVQGNGSSQYIGFEIIYGALDFRNSLYGSANADQFHGGNYRDKIFGNDGDDNLFGGGDDDLIYGGEGLDLLNGGIGNDKLFGGDANDHLVGGEGNDTLYGGYHDDTLIDLSGSNSFYGGEGFDTVLSGDGDAYVRGADFVTTGSGDDIIFVDRAPSSHGTSDIYSGGGRDEIHLENVLQAHVYTGAGDDIVTFEFSSDRVATIYGEDGNDTILGGELIFGGIGSDEIVVGGRATGYGGDGDDQIRGHGHSNLYAGRGDDILDISGTGNTYGDGGHDRFEIHGTDFGGSHFYGGAGRDHFIVTESSYLTIDGGNGYDTLTIEDGSVFIGENSEELPLSGNYITFTNIEEYVIGDGVTEIIFGIDVTEMEFTQSNLAVVFFTDGATITHSGQSGTIELEGDNGTAIGSDSGQRLYSFGENNSLYGEAGHDYLRLMGGSSVGYGGDGNDAAQIGGNNVTYFGEDGHDRVTINTYTYEAIVDTGNGRDTILTAGVDTLISTGAGADTITLLPYRNNTRAIIDTGGANDIVTANTRFESVDLSAGDDIFVIGGNYDSRDVRGTLTLGNGSDIIRAQSNSYSTAQIVITDFDLDNDLIAFNGIDQISDWSSVSERNGNVYLFSQDLSHDAIEGEGITLILEDLELSNLTDDHFNFV